MLLFVTSYTQKIGFFSRRKANRGKLPPRLTGMNVGGHPAVRLELLGRVGQEHWRSLTPYLERGDVLIADKALSPMLAAQEAYLTEYARRQCVNLALSLLKRRSTAVLVDRAGECVGVAAELLKICNTVWVATRRAELFAPCAAYTWEQYGNQPLFVTGELPCADMVVAPYGLEGWHYTGGKLFCPDGGVFPKPHEFYLPDYAHLPGFDPAAVTAGVFAAFHPKELMTALPDITR